DPFERQLQRKRKKFVIKKFGYGNKKDIGGNIIKKYNNYHYGGEDESTTIYRRRKANSNQMGKSISKT
ncbi:MAG: hypothetical protein ACE5H1_01255, partial [Thermodesulfobacteriota bacterium]